MRPPRVLLVEDDQPLIRLLAWLFEDAGFEVSSVKTPSEARERFGQHIPPVIVFNVSFPSRLKDLLIDEWRRVAPRTRFIDIRERAPGPPHPLPAARADASFEMPFDSDVLIDAARSLQL